MRGLVIALGIATVAVVTLAVRLWPEVGRQRDANAALLARVTALEGAQVAVAPAGATVADTEAGLPSPAGAMPPAAAPPVPVNPDGTSPAAGAAKPPMAGVLEAMQGPEGQDFTRTMLRSAMSQMYPDLAAELGLTDEETAKLLDLVVKQQLDLTAESVAMMTGGTDPAAMQATQRKMVEKQEAHERELTSLLGSKYPKWEEYQGTAAARQQVAQLRGTLAAGGNPLSEAQEKSLVAAFAKEQSRVAREQREWVASSAALGSSNMMQESLKQALEGQRRLLDVAAPILDATQLAHFRRQVDQQASMLGAMMGMMGGQEARQ
jgi:hypothetical protein